MKLSVIIPTYRDWTRLTLCLNALAQQTFDNSQFEVIVANNDPSDMPPADFLTAYAFDCQIVEAHQKGSYAARNVGAAIAKAPVLCFTDADCVPDSKWLERSFTQFSQPNSNTLLLSGDVVMFSEYRPDYQYNFAESYDFFFGINQKEYAARKVACTANLIMHMDVFNRVDGFNAELFSGGDVDFCSRAVNAGARFEFDDTCFVKHPLRDTFKALTIKSRRVIGARIKRQGYAKSIGTLLPPLYRIYKISGVSTVPWSLRLKGIASTFVIKVAQISEYLALLFGLKKAENR
ncbi:glycosyltransferase family 2 protein [Echinimonas agarilytica]|uniref:Glycosyltransferase family 2 protein n=1 Tax=Echinimonas agarilytica TaxID=1215918 RepID=A0AA41WBL1_9GAMM|nr:glycosyltransferase family 2 protein [Echinimonas agarilytica]